MRIDEKERLISSKPEPLGDLGHVMRRLKLDGPLLGGVLLICVLGLVVLFSAVGENQRLWLSQLVRLGVALIGMFVVAQMPPAFLSRWTPWGYAAGLVLLVLVLVRQVLLVLTQYFHQ